VAPEPLEQLDLPRVIRIVCQHPGDQVAVAPFPDGGWPAIQSSLRESAQGFGKALVFRLKRQAIGRPGPFIGTIGRGGPYTAHRADWSDATMPGAAGSGSDGAKQQIDAGHDFRRKTGQRLNGPGTVPPAWPDQAGRYEAPSR
jgi:hypothetical protein